MSALKLDDIVTNFSVSAGFAPDPTGALPLDPAGGLGWNCAKVLMGDRRPCMT